MSSIKDMVRIVPFIKHGIAFLSLHVKLDVQINACVEEEGVLFTCHYHRLTCHWRLFVGSFHVKSAKSYCFSHVNGKGVQVCKK